MSFNDSLLSSGNPSAAEVIDAETGVVSSSLREEETQELPADDAGVAELLARLDSADTWASGVEAKLDGILGTLDNLLSSLESKDSVELQEAATLLSKHPPSAPQS